MRQMATVSRSCCAMRDACCVKRRLSRITHHAPRSRAFTLLELLVVVAIMAIVMTISVPFVRTAVDGGKGMTRAVKDIQEACSHARAMAILQQTTTELIIRPGDGVFEVGRSGSGTSPGYLQHERTTSEDEYRPAARTGGGGGGFSAKLPAGIVIEGLGVNGEDWTLDSVARVRFYPNGTSDEMSVVLLSDQNERRNLWLEVVTGLPELETDAHKFKAR